MEQIKISRRSLLRGTATLTTAVLATGAIDTRVAAERAPEEAAVPADHDPATGEIFDRERHHRWDTV